MRIIFAGTSSFATTSLAALINAKHEICAVYTQPDRPAGRGRKLTASPVKQLALQHNLPIFEPLSLSHLVEQQKLAALKAEVMIVAAYGLLLPTAVLAIPSYGCINIHASCLPRWRGAAPIQRAILAGDTETGISIMQMDRSLDTGNIIAQYRCSIDVTDTTASLLTKLAVLGSEAILATLDTLSRRTLSSLPQNSQLATYASKISKAEAAIDWQKHAVAINRLVRAFNPWPVAYTRVHDMTLRIWQAESIAAQADDKPGTIIGIAKQGIDIVCGHGSILRLKEIQWPNGKRQLIEQNLLIKQLKISDKFY